MVEHVGRNCEADSTIQLAEVDGLHILLTRPVMPALVAGIHVLECKSYEDVDGRDKPGHDAA
jgi:hypothetical protein